MGSKIALRESLMEPRMTRPSARMQLTASPCIQLNVDGLLRAVHVLVFGSKTSPSGVSLPASEYSPPIANTLPSFATPEAKNCRVFTILITDDHEPVE